MGVISMVRQMSLATVALVLLAAACSSSSKGTKYSCSTWLTARATRQAAVSLTRCAGQVGVQPTLAVQAGTTITLKGIGQTYAAPTSSKVGLLAVTKVAGSMAELSARSPGTATVTLKTNQCLVVGSQAACPALIVTV